MPKTNEPLGLYEVLSEEYRAQNLTPAPPDFREELAASRRRNGLDAEGNPPPGVDEDAREASEKRVDSEMVREFYGWLHAKGAPRSALCFSGGGIRSGTFALGVLQSFARRGLLTQFDYLSTVSGGGYTGGWLTAWIHRHPEGLDGVVKELNGAKRASTLNPEPEPLRHLRDYSNFITPRAGLLSADTWTFIVIYIRNLLLNWVVLIPLLASVLMIPRVANAIVLAPQAWRVLVGLLLLGGFGILLLLKPSKKTRAGLLVLGVISAVVVYKGWLSTMGPNPEHVANIEGWLLVAGTLLGGYAMAYMRLSRPSNIGAIRPKSFWARRRDQSSFLWWCLLPLTASATLLTTFWAWFRRTTGVSTEWDVTQVHFRGWEMSEFGGFLAFGLLLGLAGWLLYVLMAGSSWLGGYAEVWRRVRQERLRLFFGILSNAARELFVTLLASVIASILLYVAAVKIPIFYDPVVEPFGADKYLDQSVPRLLSYSNWYSAELYTWLALPVYLFVFFLGITLFVGFTSRRSEKSPLERRQAGGFMRGLLNRLNPFTMSYVEDEDREWMARASAWLFIVMGGWLFFGGLVIFGPLLYLKLGAWLAGGIGGGSGLLALLGGRSGRTPGNKKEEAQQSWWQTLGVNLLVVAAFVFFACIVIAVALLSGTFVVWLASTFFTNETAALLGISARDFALFKDKYPFQSAENAFRVMHFPSWLYLLVLALGLQLFGHVCAMFINLNKFSLHAGYRDRIIRAFLGASRLRGERQENPFTGFDPRDDLYMEELRPGLLRESDFTPEGLEGFVDAVNHSRGPAAAFLRDCIRQSPGSASGRYFKEPPESESVKINPSFRSALFGDLNRILQEKDIPPAGAAQGAPGAASCPPSAPDGTDGTARIRENRRRLREAFPEYIKEPPSPYRLMHVVNMALNLVGGDRLAWQQRRAESFTASPLHSGSLFVGYRRTYNYGGNNGIKLGTAVAISGAAASSNMGYFSPSVFVTFVLTFFNARLGWWLGNPGPAGSDTYFRSHPQNALSPIIDEAFGLTDDENPYVLLSDGGHFENLGLYEMVLRRCRHIVVVDGSADPEGDYSDLAGAVRKIRIDFGIPIDFKAPFPILSREETREKKAAGAYCAVGLIHYEEVDTTPGVQPGRLIYIKPAVYGDEPRDIFNYAKGNPTFPHESTADQFFDEPQFESHRMLGYYILESLFPSDKVSKPAPPNTTPGAGEKTYTMEEFVAALTAGPSGTGSGSSDTM